MPGEIDVKVEVSGPLSDGRGLRRLRDAADDIEEKAGRRAHVLVHQRLAGSLKNPTGRFQSTVDLLHRSGDVVIPGEGTVYGRWLEGTGSRNRTTRFKGYSSFRRAGQEADREAGPIAEAEVRKLGRRL